MEKPLVRQVAEISVVIPTRCGGPLLRRVVETVAKQRMDRRFEVLLVDSGSPRDELRALEAVGARVHGIDPESFDHGRTRDLGAGLASGEILVFLNQDAVPVGDRWLAGLIEPLLSDPSIDAVQGAIAEMPEAVLAELGRSRFFWGTGGPSFYFTRESENWIRRHGGIGFSTVNCAIRKSAWSRSPFGDAQILEDKKWQRNAVERSMRITSVTAEVALVWHSHDYDLRSLWRRCASEGFGWKLLSEDYPIRSAAADLCRGGTWRELLRAIVAGRRLSAAEALFPMIRPMALWWGNHRAKGVLH